jgi:undecaprenyl-diphosphatase
MTHQLTLFHAVIYGIVQGLTEFLPVSSTGHLRIFQAWLDPSYSDKNHTAGFTAFTAVIQLGTTLAIVLYFWRELLHVGVAWLRGVIDLMMRRPDRSVRDSLEYRMGWYLIVATIPVGVIGLVLSHQIETGARNLWFIAIALIVLALLLFVAERVGSRTREEEDLNTRDAIVVGLAQAVSLIPGASRSGTTITAGLFRGLDRPTAARFSFLLSIPAVVLSGLYEARKIGSSDAPGVGITGVALVFAFIVGLASIAWLMRFLSTHGTYVFIGYRVALGALLIGLLASHTVSAT